MNSSSYNKLNNIKREEKRFQTKKVEKKTNGMFKCSTQKLHYTVSANFSFVFLMFRSGKINV